MSICLVILDGGFLNVLQTLLHIFFLISFITGSCLVLSWIVIVDNVGPIQINYLAQLSSSESLSNNFQCLLCYSSFCYSPFETWMLVLL